MGTTSGANPALFVQQGCSPELDRGAVSDLLESLAQVQATSLVSEDLSLYRTRHTFCQTPEQAELPPALKVLEFSLVGFAAGAGGACITADGWGDLPSTFANFTLENLKPKHTNERVFWGQLGTRDDLTTDTAGVTVDPGYRPGNLVWSQSVAADTYHEGEPITSGTLIEA